MPGINEPNAEPYAQDDKEDVEGHGLTAEEPNAEPYEQDDKEDVEGHVLGGQPNINEPNVN